MEELPVHEEEALDTGSVSPSTEGPLTARERRALEQGFPPLEEQGGTAPAGEDSARGFGNWPVQEQVRFALNPDNPTNA